MHMGEIGERGEAGGGGGVSQPSPSALQEWILLIIVGFPKSKKFPVVQKNQSQGGRGGGGREGGKEGAHKGDMFCLLASRPRWTQGLKL